MDVGLGYMSLGQSSTTLSGGEAQRIKLASELWRADSSAGAQQRSVVILDEPSTGLAATDVEDLARCLGRLARQGSAVVVIEHHVELLEVCDRLVELGPEGGKQGGRVLSVGSPLELAKSKDSITGPWLFQGPDGKRRWPKASKATLKPKSGAKKKAAKRAPSRKKAASARSSKGGAQ